MAKNDLAAAVYREVGRAIAEARRRRHPRITQAQLADLTNRRLSRSAIANIESGRQRVAVHHLFELAIALQVSPGELLPSAESVLDKRALAERRYLKSKDRQDFSAKFLPPSQALDDGPN